MFTRLPDWLVYLGVVMALLLGALAWRERANAPPAPPPMPGEVGPALAPASPIDPVVAVDAPERTGPDAGTAFSVGSGGVWITARHVVEGCQQVAVVVGEGRGVAARVILDPSGEAAVLTTEGGAPAVPIAPPAALRRGVEAFHPGFPQGQAGETTSRLIGRRTLVMHGPRERREAVLVWAEVGRTTGLHGTLAGLSGAPALDGAGRVIGVTIAEAPRRGRIYTTTPESLLATLTNARQQASADAAGLPITRDNYGRAADALRRNLRVVQVVCMA
jgi:S1-C subfamily serine protease